MGFAHLHLHSEYSFLDGSIKIKELFDRVKEIGQDSVAITEHGHMHALVQKYKLAKKAGVKLIVGCEVYVCSDIGQKDKKRNHFLLLAENNEGLANLNKIISIANKDGFYYKPRVDKSLLRKYSKGIIASTACIAGDVQQALIHNDYQRAKHLALEYQEIFGKDNFFFEFHNHFIEEEQVANEGMLKLSRELGIRGFAANDAHYLKKEDSVAHDILLCIQTKKKVEDRKRLKFPGSHFYVKTEEEMLELFPNNPEFIYNTQEIADRCNVELDLGNTYFPEFSVDEGEDYKSVLKKLCYEGLDKKYGRFEQDFYVQAKERLDFEISVINKMGFAAYFLIVADFIREAKSFCQVGPGRGSGAGSIVAYVLGITQLEPLSLQLLFERFLNPERISLPDFDVDFGDRDMVLDYIREKYGEDKVALIGTYGTMMAKAVLKDVARALDIPFEVANKMTKFVTEKTIADSLELKDDTGKLSNQELIAYEKKYPFLFEIAQKLEGTVRQPGIHACGVVWGPKQITHYLPVFRKDNNIVTQMDKDEVEQRGLVKFDFLGLETLNVIQKVLDHIGKSGEWLESISLDDENVYKMLASGRSIGVFQLESAGMQKTLKSVKPVCFDDIIAIVALYRPGSMDFIDVYVRRKDGKEEVTYPHPLAEDILKPTYGILVYQEQVMLLSRVLAGFSMGDSDVLRKAIGKKKLDLMQKMQGQFKKGCKSVANMKKSVIDSLWDNIVKFASYSFNKSHAAAYAMISYRTAFLKFYYPLEFFTATISSATNDIEKMAFYVSAAKDEGIRILPPHINFSRRNFSFEKVDENFVAEKVDDKGAIRFGFSGIKNVGESAIEEILSNRPFKNFQDFINKVDLSKINKRVQKHLIMCGAFEGLGHNRAELLNSFQSIKKQDVNKSQQRNLFGSVANQFKIEQSKDCSLGDILGFETQILGLPISGHLLDQYPLSKSQRFDKLDSLREDRELECFGLVKSFRKILTRKGDEMAFVDLEDRTGVRNVVVFPNVFSKFNFSEVGLQTPLIVSGFLKDGSFIASEVIIYKQSSKRIIKEQSEQVDQKGSIDSSLKKYKSVLSYF